MNILRSIGFSVGILLSLFANAQEETAPQEETTFTASYDGCKDTCYVEITWVQAYDFVLALPDPECKQTGYGVITGFRANVNGHICYVDGPTFNSEVFYHLRNSRPGDQVIIDKVSLIFSADGKHYTAGNQIVLNLIHTEKANFKGDTVYKMNPLSGELKAIYWFEKERKVKKRKKRSNKI